MAFRRQWIAWDETLKPVPSPATSGTANRSLDALLARVAESNPGARPQAVTVFADPRLPVVVELERQRRVSVDPFRGEVTPIQPGRARAVLRWMENCHRWLGANEPSRKAGEGGGPTGWTPRRITSTVMGGSALVFLTLSLSPLPAF